jgi:HEPN domain-containing protein
MGEAGTGRPARVPRTVRMGQRFFQQAEVDLHFAQKNVEIGGFYVAAYLAHQAAEKALKAAHWHLRAEEPAWGHRLNAVAARVAERAGGLPALVTLQLGVLEPIFELTRYPSERVEEPIPAQLITEADAREALNAAEEVMAWVRELLRQPHGRAQRLKRS